MDHAGDCPICGKETENINNHIRMSSGDHGPRGQYPANYDKQSRTLTEGPADEQEQPEPTFSETNDVTPSQMQKSHSDESEPSGGGAESLQLSDDPQEARTYNCGECGAAVEYLNDCPDCGELLAWVGVQQEVEA